MSEISRKERCIGFMADKNNYVHELLEECTRACETELVQTLYIISGGGAIAWLRAIILTVISIRNARKTRGRYYADEEAHQTDGRARAQEPIYDYVAMRKTTMSVRSKPPGLAKNPGNQEGNALACARVDPGDDPPMVADVDEHCTGTCTTLSVRHGKSQPRAYPEEIVDERHPVDGARTQRLVPEGNKQPFKLIKQIQ
ncbi:unnamed protein product [Trichogramma brassicae]|uniref:Uncharacterized protein n=1 Tax=Trichogramma brassicae TaxID=86971 RepID=A0A6H5I9X4_9HYME|nr:unnamed protein product [Trichogramma brassicae]